MTCCDTNALMGPFDVWGYSLKLLNEPVTENCLVRYGGGRWIMQEIIFTWYLREDDPDEQERDQLRQWLCGLRRYAEVRGNRSLEETVAWCTEHAAELLPDSYRPDCLPTLLSDFEAIYQTQADAGQVENFIASLPLPDDPTDEEGMVALFGTWFKEPKLDGSDLPSDPTWFGMEHVLQLQTKIAAHPLAAELLNRLNDWLTTKKVGKIDFYVVAVVGCVWRKNIRSNRGEVPQDAFDRFCEKSGGLLSKDKPLPHLQVKVAKQILEAVGFMRMIQPHDRNAGRCAVYELLNQSQWE